VDDQQTTELTDEQITTTMPGSAGTTRAETERPGDGTDGDATDGTDGDAQDADGTDGDASDATDGDAQDADGTDAAS
jgi:hypothetical protein